MVWKSRRVLVETEAFEMDRVFPEGEREEITSGGGHNRMKESTET